MPAFSKAYGRGKRERERGGEGGKGGGEREREKEIEIGRKGRKKRRERGRKAYFHHNWPRNMEKKLEVTSGLTKLAPVICR